MEEPVIARGRAVPGHCVAGVYGVQSNLDCSLNSFVVRSPALLPRSATLRLGHDLPFVFVHDGARIVGRYHADDDVARIQKSNDPADTVDRVLRRRLEPANCPIVSDIAQALRHR